jgi:outer membrane autotransporter protein
MSFQSARANQLLSNQTGLTSLLTGASETGSAKLSFTDGRGNFDLQTAKDGRVWTRIAGSFSNGASDQSYVLGTIGSHKKLSDNLLIGGMVQFDQFEQSDDSSSVKGKGWLVGPYVVAKHATQPLYFEGRLLYGASSNDVSPYNTYTDTFKTKRTLAHAKLTGEVDMGEFKILPNASLAYTKDSTREYTDSLGNIIPSQSVALTQGTAGINLRKTVDTAGGALTMTAGFSGIYSDVSTIDGASSTADYEGGRGKVDVGLSFKGDKGLNYSLGAYFDGIGADGYSVTGANAGIQLNF